MTQSCTLLLPIAPLTAILSIAPIWIAEDAVLPAFEQWEQEQVAAVLPGGAP